MIVNVAHVEGYVHGGVGSELCEEVTKHDGGTKSTGAPASVLDSAALVQDATLSVGVAGIPESGGAGVANDAGDGVPTKDARKETPVAPATESEGAPPVQHDGINVGAADIGTPDDVSDGVGEVVHDKSRRGGSSSNIAKRCKRAGRNRKAAAARLSPYTTPTTRRYSADRKRGRARRTGTAAVGHLQGDEAVSIEDAEVADVVPLATLSVGSEEHMEASHARPHSVRVATSMYCVLWVNSFWFDFAYDITGTRDG